MGARYYESSSGRFLSPDPYGHAASLSLYDYASGDPINFVDPTGRLQKLQNFASEAGLLGNDIGISMAANDGSMFVEGHLKHWDFATYIPTAKAQMRAQVAKMFVGDEKAVQAVSDRFFFETLAPRIAEELEGEKAAALAWNAAMTEYRQSPAAQAQRTVMEVGVGLLNLSGINGVQGKTQEVVLRFNGDTGLIEPTIVTSEISGGAQALEIAMIVPIAKLGKAVGLMKFGRATETITDLSYLRGGGNSSSYGVSFFDNKVAGVLDEPGASLGRSGQQHFFMPIDDAVGIRNAADAARETGMAPSVVRAYISETPIYGISFPTNGLSIRVPTAADAGGWQHFLEGGRTAVFTGGNNGGYLLNSTREFVTPGGAMPTGSVLFRLEPNGAWTPLRRY